MFVSKGNIKFLFYMYTYDDMPLLMSMNGESKVSKFARVHAPQIMILLNVLSFYILIKKN